MSAAETRPPDPPSALPRGTRLDEFELRRVLGIGGFGIVYLAFDHALEREVAIKEYMPSSLAGRSGPLQVSLLSEAHAEPFSRGLRSFVNEARLLARFDHPSLVKVHRYWEANGTAYMAMPFYGGRNLHATRRGMAQPPHESWLRAILDPLLGAIERLHAEGVYHRDISPDNVILQPDGRPVLLDFGAARRVLGDKSMALTAILKPAYAPIEQYAEAGAVKQGPWTDLYALGGTLHYLLLGRAPVPATTRTVVDEMPTLLSQQAALPGCSAGFLQCVDWMLQPRPADRPQQVAALRERLAGLPPPPAPAPDADDGRWQPTQRLAAAPGAHDDTVLDPGLLPGTLPAAPAPDNRPTEVLARPDAATQVMTRHRPAETAAEATPAARSDDMPAAPAPLGGPAPAAPPPPGPGRAAPPGPGEPAHGGMLLAADDQDRAWPRAGPPARRWPWAVGLAGAAGLALWLGLRPAGDPAPASPGPPASAAGDLPSPALPVPAAAPGTADVAGAAPASAPPSPAATALGATASPPAASARAAGPPASAGPAEPATARTAGRSAAPGRPVAPAPDAPAPGRTARPGAPPPADPAGPAPVTLPPAHPGGLATSITRLPPADPGLAGPAAAASAPAAGQASAPLAGAARGTAAQVVEAGRGSGAGSAPPPQAGGNPTPVAVTARPAVPPAPASRAPERDADGVSLQTRALGPAERCEGRALLALWSCVDRICRAEPGLRDHPDCVKSRRDADLRGQGTR